MKRFIPYIKYFTLALILLVPLAETHATNPVGSLFGFTNFFDFTEVIISHMSYWILWFVARLLWFAGIIFDMSISISLNMAGLLTSVPVVDIGWVIFRDLANMLFIFILIYTGIKTIIGLGGNTGEIVTKIIIMALLINFSLFITKTIVDASNIMALQFYRAMVPLDETYSFGDFRVSNGAIAAKFMSGLDLRSIYEYGASTKEISKNGSVEEKFGGQNNTSQSGGLNDSQKNFVRGGLKLFGAGFLAKPLGLAQDGNATLKIISVTFFGSILILVAAFVFFAGAILFAIRSVVLLLLMILSPLAFAGELLPKTKSYADQWWDTLINQAIFAPLYLAMIYVVVRAINTQAFAETFQSGGGLAGALGTSGGSGGAIVQSVGTIVGFIIVIILLSASLLIAKKLGAVGSDAARSIAGKATFGIAGAVGRRTVGRLGQTVADSKTFKDIAAKTGFAGRLSTKALKGVAGSSFDIRAGTPGKGLADLVGGLGKAEGKGGYTETLKGKIKEEKEYVKYLGKGEGGETRKEQYVGIQNLKQQSVINILTGRAKVIKESLPDIQKEIEEEKIPQLKEELSNKRKDLRSVNPILAATDPETKKIKEDLEKVIGDLEAKIGKAETRKAEKSLRKIVEETTERTMKEKDETSKKDEVGGEKKEEKK